MKERFLSQRQRYSPISLPQNFTDEEMARDWTLTERDLKELGRYRMVYRLYIAVQFCGVRLYGRFLGDVDDLSVRILSYLSEQLNLLPTMTIQKPERRATRSDYQQKILVYLGFKRFDEAAEEMLRVWLTNKAEQRALPDSLFPQAEQHLLDNFILLPGPTILERLIIRICNEAHEQFFEVIYQWLSPEMQQEIDKLLTVNEGEQRSYFSQLKAYPPTATVSSIRDYLKQYWKLAKIDIDALGTQLIDPAFQNYLFQLAKQYDARDMKRLNTHKRYALMTCFLLETRKNLLDHIVKMHDQYIIDICRRSRNTYEKKHRELRKRQKRAVDTVLNMSAVLLDWADDEPLTKEVLWSQVNENAFRSSLDDLRLFKTLEERGYGDILIKKYPSLRKYFSSFVQLPFAAEHGSAPLLKSIEIIRQLDAQQLKQIPPDAPTSFVPRELRRALTDNSGKINRNAWEMGLALAIKDALRSGDLYLPQSKQHVSFWNMMLSDAQYQIIRDGTDFQYPAPEEIRQILTTDFESGIQTARERFPSSSFAEIADGQLKLKRDDRAKIPSHVKRLQKLIDSSMPTIRIERLLMEVDQLTNFSQHFRPVQGHPLRPNNFYKTLLATIISQATNLGVVAMSASVSGITVDMLRQLLGSYIREETLKAASAELVNRHHELPLASLHGSGEMSSSDAQRFGIRASSLLASYYPRYYGYYRKAIGIYTHVSDQYAVFGTKVISCSPREALYVLDGLLENNSVLKIQKHTTDTGGYTEIIFALCYLLGYEFMPRIRDLKDQQLYKVRRGFDYGEFAPLLTKSANIDIVEEQWASMLRVAVSLLQRTAPAHIVVQRLINSFPSDRLSKAFTHLGRILKTQYILRYLTDADLRRSVQRQLNKGEYRHKLPRWIFFANQGEFLVGDYEEIMNKASCLSLVSNAILYWNTRKIDTIIQNLRQQGEEIDDETLSHISLLPFKHVLPNGTYFIEAN